MISKNNILDYLQANYKSETGIPIRVTGFHIAFKGDQVVKDKSQK